ncbi:MAG: maleylpyruvate isomerase family mycothiol-dependent enzyme [Kineosporiaceae bacterium]
MTPETSRHADPDADMVRAGVAERTVAFAAAAARLTDADVRSPSGLPGWTRGHVLAHVRLNAEAFVGVLASAAAGDLGRMYPSRESRDADIEAGAGASAAEHVAGLLDSAERLAADWAALPATALDGRFTTRAGLVRPVHEVAFFRWREVVLHHVDLHPADSSPHPPALVLAAAGPLVVRLLDETCSMFAARDDVPPLAVSATDVGRDWVVGDAPTGRTAVSGGAPALAAWLTGRSDGADLTASGPLPALPAWA